MEKIEPTPDWWASSIFSTRSHSRAEISLGDRSGTVARRGRRAHDAVGDGASTRAIRTPGNIYCSGGPRNVLDFKSLGRWWRWWRWFAAPAPGPTMWRRRRGPLRNIFTVSYYLICFDMKFSEIISGIDLGMHAEMPAGRAGDSRFECLLGPYSTPGRPGSRAHRR